MMYSVWYDSPLGRLFLVSDETHLIGLWFEGQKYFVSSLTDEIINKPNLPIFSTTQSWLDDYFSGKKPSISDLSLAPAGSEFRTEVWNILCSIPYGQTITYGKIAKMMAQRMKKPGMSSQAIGGAVGHNPISIIIPCHRVVGAKGKLTGYAGGIEKKIKLLELEQATMSK
jgi:methylated-DNA-[protein]-cysteine S-methyltransferase